MAEGGRAPMPPGTATVISDSHTAEPGHCAVLLRKPQGTVSGKRVGLCGPRAGPLS